MNRRYLLIVAVLAMGSDRPALGQTLPRGYGEFYGQNARTTPSLVSTNRYLYDKYFYHQPSVSPYLNLGRRGTQSGDAYSVWVKPEKQRRQQASQAMRQRVADLKMSGKVGHTDYARALGQAVDAERPSIAGYFALLQPVVPQAGRPLAGGPTLGFEKTPRTAGATRLGGATLLGRWNATPVASATG